MTSSGKLLARHNDCRAECAPVLVVHGAGQNGARLAPLLDALAARGRPAVTIDLPGHGGSAGSALRDIPEMARRLVDEVVEEGPMHLAGHSMGGLIALEMAAQSPGRFLSLSLLGAIAPMPVAPELLAKAEKSPEDAVEMMLEWGYTGTPEQGDRDTLLAIARADSVLQSSVLATDLAACAEYTAGLERAEELQLPALVMAGRRDAMTPARQARRLIRALGEPRVEWLNDAGHFLADEVPVATGAILADFLNQADDDRRLLRES